jgi:paraquat-inducible protein B
LSSTDIQEEVIQNGSEQIMDGEIETSAQMPEAESTTTEELMAKIEAELRAIIKENLRRMEEEKKQTPEETEVVEEPQEVLDGVMEVEEQPTPKETDAVKEPQEFPKGATDEEKFGATKDRAGEQRLDVLPAVLFLQCTRGMSAGDRVRDATAMA